LIKALEATLAPFAQPEKPQVFPMHAPSFIKSGPHTIMLEGDRQTPPSCMAQISLSRRWYPYARFDCDFCGDLTQSGGASRSFERGRLLFRLLE
jgi:hypothetical protein